MESNTIKTVFVLTLLLTTYVFSSCSRNPYAATNKSYRKQADHYADILENTRWKIPTAMRHILLAPPTLICANQTLSLFITPRKIVAIKH